MLLVNFFTVPHIPIINVLQINIALDEISP